MELEVSNLAIPVAPRNPSPESRAQLFGFCFGMIYAVALIAAIVQVAA
jgi:hypothetical protein